MQEKQRTYIAIDLKSFFASVECVERNLDPLTTNLVVADENNEILNRRLAILREHLKETPEVAVTFFQPDGRKAGGSYETCTGFIKDIDDYEQKLVMTDGKKIALPSVLDIDSKLFDNEEI